MRTAARFLALSALVAATSLTTPIAAASAPRTQGVAGPSAAAASSAGSQNWPRISETHFAPFEAKPARLYDSRTASGFVNPEFSGKTDSVGPIGAFQTRHFEVNKAMHHLVLNVTVVNPETGGFLTVWKGNSSRPLASSINFTRGQAIANQVHLDSEVVGGDGSAEVTKFAVYSHAKTHFTIDIVGSYLNSSRFESITPRRVHDSREPGSARPLGRVTTVYPDVPSGGSRRVEAVVANVTIVGRGVPGFATVWHDGDRPTASTLNYVGDSVISNQVITKIAANDSFKVYTHSHAEVIVDVVGYIWADEGIRLHKPVRLLDERTPDKYCCHRIKSDLIRLQVEQRQESPSWNKDNAIVNITVVGSTKPGFVSARKTEFKSFDDKTTAAETSTQNYKAGTVRAGMAIVPVSEQGVIEIYRMGDAKVIVDLVGYTSKGREETRPFYSLWPVKYIDVNAVVGRQGRVELTLPELFRVQKVWIGESEIPAAGSGTRGYSSNGRKVTVPGEVFSSGSGVLEVVADSVLGDDEKPVPGFGMSFFVPVSVVDGSANSRPVELAFDGYHWEQRGVRTENRSGQTYEFPLQHRAWAGPITIAPGSGYSGVPISEFGFGKSGDNKTLYVRMPSQEALRKYLGMYGAQPGELTLHAKTPDGKKIVFSVKTVRR